MLGRWGLGLLAEDITLGWVEGSNSKLVGQYCTGLVGRGPGVTVGRWSRDAELGVEYIFFSFFFLKVI